MFDRNHFNIVNENGAVRLAAENTHNNYLTNINNRLSDIKVDVASVILVQTMIKSSLVQVNKALKSGLQVKQIIEISNNIISESNSIIEIAGSEPYLLLFAEDMSRQTKIRAVNLVTEVSAFVLKEGDNVLMDYEKRDALLFKIVLELRVLRSMVYGIYRSMYWAKLNGVLKTLNPYRGFINQDRRMGEEIIYNLNNLKP